MEYRTTASLLAGLERWGGSRQRTYVALFLILVALAGSSSVSAQAQSTRRTYSGLFADPDGVTPASCGSFTLTTTAKGTFTGRIQIGSARGSFKGTIVADGSATATAKRGKASPVTINLQWQTTDSGDRIVGNLSDGTWTALLRAERAFAATSGVTAPQTGKYTVVLAATAPDPQQPRGSGFGTINVSKLGRAKLAATLADGAKVSQSAPLSAAGEWPLYVAPYKSQGLLAGWLAVTNSPGTAVSGTTTWIKQTGTATKFYPSGFSNLTSVAGSTFKSPAKGTAILRFTVGDLSLEGGDLTSPLHERISLDSKNRVKSMGPASVKLSFANSSGLFHGTIKDSSLPRTLSFAGVVLQAADQGAGTFKGTSQYGNVVLLEVLSSATQILAVQTLGPSFTSDVRLKSAPDIFRWDWSDGAIATSYPIASHDFGSPGARVQTLAVQPVATVDSINLGFDGSDGGTNTPLGFHSAENIGSVDLLMPLTGLRYFASSYAPITNTLDFSGCASLERIECFHCTNLTRVAVANLPSLKRVCLEACPLEELDLSGNPNLEDIRAAVSGYPSITLGGGTGPNVWHFCSRDNPQLTQNLTSVLTNFFSLREMWIWNDNQTGALTVASTNLVDVEFENNHYEYASFANQPSLKRILGWSNMLTNIDLSGCTALEDVELSQNQLSTAALDAVLHEMDVNMPNLQTADLSSNPQLPSASGYNSYSNLTNRGVSVFLP